METHKATVYSLAVLAMFFWGVSYVWSKIVFEFYPPITVMFIRLAISSGLLALLFRQALKKIDRTDYQSFVVLSFFSPFCYFIGENFGLMQVSPTVASVVIATIPVFAPVLGFLAFRERISLVNTLGFLVGFSGIWVMVLDQDFRFSASPLGVFLLFFAVGSALVNMVFLKRLVMKYSSLTIISVQNLLGALFFLPLFLVFDLKDFVQVRPSREAVASLLALAVFGSTLAFIFYTKAVGAIGIARTAIFGNLIPVVTAITSLVVLKEAIDKGKVLGMMLVIVGLLMTQVSAIRRRNAGRSPASPKTQEAVGSKKKAEQGLN
ncbi:MAG: DMT family transporter [Bacteroidales bacterium]